MQANHATCLACGAFVDEGRTDCQECGAVLADLGAAATPAPATEPPPTAAPVHLAAPTIERKPVAGRELGPNAWYSVRSRARPAGGRAGVFSDLPVELPGTRGGRLAVIGLLVIALSLLLPWAPVANFVSYFDAWGLGRPSTIVVFVLALVLLVLALEPVPLSMRLRTGWLPVLFGAFGVGLAWSRIDGGLAFIDVGGWLFALGGCLAVVGGLFVLAGGIEEPTKG
jgi:hypothetical protein